MTKGMGHVSLSNHKKRPDRNPFASNPSAGLHCKGVRSCPRETTARIISAGMKTGDETLMLDRSCFF